MTAAGKIWDKEALYRLVRESLRDYLFLVVSNRESYVHSFSGGDITCIRPVGGLTQALDPVMRASGGSWVAYGGGDADPEVVDEHGRVAVPPENPEYTLRRVWLTEQEVAGYYLGFANEGLWPLCHVTFTRPEFRESNWEYYKEVNGRFADAVLEEVSSRRAIVLVQDYHFALLPRMLKERSPSLVVGQFWHIPWPQYDIFRVCPWAGEIMAGLLGNDLLGFHTQPFCHNFLESAGRTVGARVEGENSVLVYKDTKTVVKPYPISVDFAQLSGEADTDRVKEEMDSLTREYSLQDKLIGIGMDRMDYTKGIPERLQALDRFFARHPEYRERVVFIQAGMPSRTGLSAYRSVMDRIENLTAEINERYATDSWKPVIAMSRQLTPAMLFALRRLAHFCMVSSLHDGMNLVAKEYVASRVDGDGVLLLSRFTGAADEMGEALMVNPYDVEGFAERIKEALEMPEQERKRRMAAMRKRLAERNIYWWGASMVNDLITMAGAT